MTLRSVARDIMPPIIWRSLRRAVNRERSARDPVAGVQRSAQWYDAMYERREVYHRHYADSPYYPLWCVLIDRMKPASVRAVLDIGCGPGQSAAFLRDRGLKRYVGLDFSAEAIRMARLACPEFEFICADALSSEILSRTDYEVLVATEFLEHVHQDLAIVERIRAGTKVYGTVPNFPDPGHVHHFETTTAVATRYAPFLSDFRVDEFLFGSGGMRHFLFEGIRLA